jgi:hypothetical protein
MHIETPLKSLLEELVICNLVQPCLVFIPFSIIGKFTHLTNAREGENFTQFQDLFFYKRVTG